MPPETINALPAFLQYGALGLCALILLAWFWSVTRFVRVMEKALDVIPALTETVNKLRDEVDTGNQTSSQIRDRMLQWECPFRHKHYEKEPPACATA